MNKKVLSSLLHYWWVNHFSDSYKITACSVNTSTVAGCFASFDNSENAVKNQTEHKGRPQGVVVDRSVLDGVERNPPRKRKKTNSFLSSYICTTFSPFTYNNDSEDRFWKALFSIRTPNYLRSKGNTSFP